MEIRCPECRSRYRIDPSQTTKKTAKVKCPRCRAVFSVQIPSSEIPVVQRAVSSAPKQNPGKVLVVDDARFFRELVSDVLDPLWLDLQLVESAESAMESLEQELPCLIILDLNLPGKNGYEFIREIRSDDRFSGVRILAMSGVFRKDEDGTEATRAGADDFMNKSFKPEQLQERVRKLIR